MIYIEAESINELFVSIAQYMLDNGVYSSPRGKKTLELQNVWLTLHNPLDPIVSLPARNINMEYLHGEFQWYVSGSLNVSDINKFSSFWDSLADSNGTVNSNYGFIALKEKWSGKSQVEWCIDRLHDDIHSRQAVINYNQPRHKYVGNKDFVCTLSQQFRINSEGALDTIVHMRSNDLIFGFSYDVQWFTYLQEYIANSVGVPVGRYHHIAQSLHVYEKHFEMLRNIAGSNPYE